MFPPCGVSDQTDTYKLTRPFHKLARGLTCPGRMPTSPRGRTYNPTRDREYKLPRMLYKSALDADKPLPPLYVYKTVPDAYKL